MRPITSRPAALSYSPLLILGLAHGALAQTPASATLDPNAKPPVAGSKQGDGVAPADDVTAGLPKFLKLVPGGKVELGLTTDEFADAAQQVVFPSRPEMAVKMSEEKVKRALRQAASLLGRQAVQVDTYLLGEFPVTNAQYAIFIEEMRKLGKKVRPPFHWWRFGREDDYNAKLEEINKAFPKDPAGPVNYWERHGDELPFKVADKDGKSIADMPVTFVMYSDANAFAAWLGMRLPTEAEWMRAARGDSKDVWPCGQPTFTEKLLSMLQMNSSKNQEIKPIGTVQQAAGPFGHKDMFGQVWQYVAELGYDPLTGKDAFAAEWKKVGKHKVASLLEAPPLWEANDALAKGGSYLSFQEPIQLLIDIRAPMSTREVLEGLGFRLAKSLRPGYDMLFSLLRGVFNRGLFLEGQDIDLSLQVGAERYELDKDGFPTSYQAVSFAPVNWLTNDKSQDLNKLLDRSQEAPVLIGTLATTAAMVEPAVAPGHFSVQFRREGMPRELSDALKTGYKEVQAEKRRREKAKKESDEEPKWSSWSQVLPRFGITIKDLEDAAQVTDIKFVRIDGVEVSTETDNFLLSGLEGKIVAVIPGTKKKPAQGNAFAPTVSVEADGKGRAKFLFHVGTPVQMQNLKRFVDLQLQLTLDLPAPAAEKPWRIQGN